MIQFFGKKILTVIKIIGGFFLIYTAQASTTLNQIEMYLNSFKSLEGRFEQLTDNGELFKGKFSLLKPGKLRLDYYKPSTQIIFSNDNTLYVYDQLTNDVTQVPLDQSVAEVLLSEFIIVNEDTFTINKFDEEQNIVKLTLSKKDNPDTGSLTLVFQKNPLKLIQWVIIDFQNQRTVVNLYDIKINTLRSLDTRPNAIINGKH